jgi:hypothetical protein
LWTDRLRTKPGNAWIAADHDHFPLTPTVDDCGAVSELTGYHRHEQGPVGRRVGPESERLGRVLLALKHC